MALSIQQLLDDSKFSHTNEALTSFWWSIM